MLLIPLAVVIFIVIIDDDGDVAGEGEVFQDALDVAGEGSCVGGGWSCGGSCVLGAEFELKAEWASPYQMSSGGLKITHDFPVRAGIPQSLRCSRHVRRVLMVLI